MLSYDNLLSEALKALPEMKEEYDKLISQDEIDKNSGMHIVFDYTLIPIILRSVKDNNKAILKICFQFIEQMASSEDRLVGEVCDFSILERLNDELDDSVLLPLLGEKSKENFYDIKQYMK